MHTFSQQLPVAPNRIFQTSHRLDARPACPPWTNPIAWCNGHLGSWNKGWHWPIEQKWKSVKVKKKESQEPPSLLTVLRVYSCVWYLQSKHCQKEDTVRVTIFHANLRPRLLAPAITISESLCLCVCVYVSCVSCEKNNGSKTAPPYPRHHLLPGGQNHFGGCSETMVHAD